MNFNRLDVPDKTIKNILPQADFAWLLSPTPPRIASLGIAESMRYLTGVLVLAL
jgi:hypothetical protein